MLLSDSLIRGSDSEVLPIERVCEMTKVRKLESLSHATTGPNSGLTINDTFTLKDQFRIIHINRQFQLENMSNLTYKFF